LVFREVVHRRLNGECNSLCRESGGLIRKFRQIAYFMISVDRWLTTKGGRQKEAS